MDGVCTPSTLFRDGKNMTNEHIVEQIKQGYSTVKNLQWLYEKNLTLIKKIVLPYTKYEEEEDLLQEAYFGIYNAVQHYESDKEVKFMTYAQYWIKESVREYINNCGTLIRLPAWMNQRLYIYRKTFNELYTILGRMPEVEELAKAMTVSVAEIKEYILLTQKIVSLDAVLYEDDDDTFGNTLESSDNVESEALEKAYQEFEERELWKIVKTATNEIENEILKRRYIDQCTYSQIAEEYSLTVGKVRRIEEKALQKLRLSKNKKRIQERLEITESALYRTGVRKFLEYGNSSVEYTAIKKMELNGYA